jgi:hypothetical protein
MEPMAMVPEGTVAALLQGILKDRFKLPPSGTPLTVYSTVYCGTGDGGGQFLLMAVPTSEAPGADTLVAESDCEKPTKVAAQLWEEKNSLSTTMAIRVTVRWEPWKVIADVKQVSVARKGQNSEDLSPGSIADQAGITLGSAAVSFEAYGHQVEYNVQMMFVQSGLILALRRIGLEPSGLNGVGITALESSSAGKLPLFVVGLWLPTAWIGAALGNGVTLPIGTEDLALQDANVSPAGDDLVMRAQVKPTNSPQPLLVNATVTMKGLVFKHIEIQPSGTCAAGSADAGSAQCMVLNFAAQVMAQAISDKLTGQALRPQNRDHPVKMSILGKQYSVVANTYDASATESGLLFIENLAIGALPP